MVKRNEPQVVYCDQGHIYDKSLSIECPYCNKIKKKMEIFSGFANLFSRKNDDAAYLLEDVTELSDDATELSDDATELSDDATELSDDATELSDDATELLDDATELAGISDAELVYTSFSQGYNPFGASKGTSEVLGETADASIPLSTGYSKSREVSPGQTNIFSSWKDDYEFEIDIPRGDESNIADNIAGERFTGQDDLVEEISVAKDVQEVMEAEPEPGQEVRTEDYPVKNLDNLFEAEETDSVIDDSYTALPINSEEEKQSGKEAGFRGAELLQISVAKGKTTLQSPDRKNVSRTGNVLGWLVITMGQERGRSFEICDGYNFVTFDDEGHIMVSDFEPEEKKACAKIYYDEVAKDFCIEKVEDGDIYINDSFLEETDILGTGDIVSFDQAEAQFYPLLGIGGFDWRQV